MWRLRDCGERNGMAKGRNLGSGVGRLLGRVWGRIDVRGEGSGRKSVGGYGNYSHVKLRVDGALLSEPAQASVLI